jgi:hypothetical protein
MRPERFDHRKAVGGAAEHTIELRNAPTAI